MKRWSKWFAAGVILTLLLGLLFEFFRTPTQFSVGSPLSPGKVLPQLVNTWDTAVLLAPDGSLWGWGGSQFDLQGLFPTPTRTMVPRRVGSETDWCKVAASNLHTLALKTDGSLWGWGKNSEGQLAQSSLTNRFTKPVRIGVDSNWSQISVGMGHCLALKNDGSLWAWGQNDRGQVGDGSTNNRATLSRIGQNGAWKAITAGAFNSYALRADGTLWGWGLDPITSGTHDVLSPLMIDPNTNWVSISAGEFCLLALRSDGTLWVRGQNAHSAAPAYAKSSASALIRIGTDTDWKEVYAGEGYLFARKRDNSWWACGDNSYGELGIASNGSIDSPKRVPLEFEPWAFLPGYGTTVLLTKDGKLWTWGKRLGSGRSHSLLNALKESLNRILPGKRTIFKEEDPITDREPHLLWRLPSEVRHSLKENSKPNP